MSDDKYKPVAEAEHTLQVYPSGLRVGMVVRLKGDLHTQDHEGRPTGEMHRAGEVWRVLAGHPDEPTVVWLREPGGSPHTWEDADVLEWFEIGAV